jgi:hypothetical protein
VTRTADRDRLARLTARWRARHDAGRPAVDARPAADAEREALADRTFPHRDVTPAEYVADHGKDMVGFTFDEQRYADPALDAWLLEVGRLLRERR